VNLTLGFFWLVMGVLLLAAPWIDPEDRLALTRRGMTAPIGAIAVFMAFYNFARWWSSRSLAADRRAVQEALARRRLADRNENSHKPQREPDPSFDFSERPPSHDGS
jgi:hypothetical protein